MSGLELSGWDRLRHGGLLLDPQRLGEMARLSPEPLTEFHERELRRYGAAVLDGSAEIPAFVSFVLEKVCGFSDINGTWKRGPNVPPEWGRVVVTGETVKPRQLWLGHQGGSLPVFLDSEKRIGVGRGRRAVSQVLQWLRGRSEHLALLTNGRQWRLIFAGLDFDAWCEWDLDLWFEEGGISSQVSALRTLLSPAAWTPAEKGATSPLLRAVLDSRKGQSDLSAVLGERVREAVELLVQGHGEALKEVCADVDPADIYRAAVRVIMRLVVILFAESRELLPAENAVYHGSYGLKGLLEELERVAARGGTRLTRSWSAWPRVLALFRLVHEGSHHHGLPVPAYGGELFAPGNPEAADGLSRALALFENTCYEREILPDRDVYRILERITRTRVKVRQGRSRTCVPAPVDFSDLSSEYIGILYEGLLDFELKTAPTRDPVIFLAVGNQPALPLSRLEAMDDKALASLLEKMKDTSGGEEEKGEETEGETEEESGEDQAEEEPEDEGEGESPPEDEEKGREDSDDERHNTRVRAETWARRAVDVGSLVRKPKGKMAPEKRLVFEEMASRKARQLVSRVILPGEWYLLRWGGTRKGSGTFYTRPGLAVPTVQRTLCPLACDPPLARDGRPDREAPPGLWKAKQPEEILSLKVCDPACGSGSFLVAALRFLTDHLYGALFLHNRLEGDIGRPMDEVLGLVSSEESVEGEEATRLPCRPDENDFEPRAKAVLRRYVVERCLYGVDLDPLAVELCRLALWIETMDRELPFTFLDHKIRCGNSLVGAWLDQFQHYPAMAFKNREGGDKGYTNGVHFEKEARTKAIKDFVKQDLAPDLLAAVVGQKRVSAPPGGAPQDVHGAVAALMERLHGLPIHDAYTRALIYGTEVLGSQAYRTVREAMDLWCACWFWPPEELGHAPMPSTFGTLEENVRRVTERVSVGKRFFHWELEFPDVFNMRRAGFDAVVGNPPWDIAKPVSKEFFSNIDPLYRSYGKQEAIQYQREYFEDEGIERAWLDYNADFKAQSNFMRYCASAFGDPEQAEKSADRFTVARGKENDSLHRTWRKARGPSKGYADPQHPFRHQGSADINLYKLFLEQGHALLRKGGRLGFIVPSGLYSDHGTGALRHLFLQNCRWEWLFGFENKDGIFDIHRSFKFNPVIIEKGGSTEAIRTAFMRRRLEDWERAESFSTPYGREQVEKFSPRSKAILEIQSSRDLEILEKIYSNSVLLGDEGPDGWGIKYATEFHMTNDSKLFPPRPEWEAQGYCPDEYSRWLKGDWRPIEELWAELGVHPLPEGERRCAQPPYDRLPIPRADIPEGVVLSREADAWIKEDKVEDTALPFMQGAMLQQFDFSQKGWVRGTGLQAKWEPIGWDNKVFNPQFLMALYQSNYDSRTLHRRVARNTDTRMMIASFCIELPAGDKAPILKTNSFLRDIFIVSILNSYVFDYILRNRCGSTNIDLSSLEVMPLPKIDVENYLSISSLVLKLNLSSHIFSKILLCIKNLYDKLNAICPVYFKDSSLTTYERLRSRTILDALIALQYGLNYHGIGYILRGCDFPLYSLGDPITRNTLPPKGFWRVDKDKDPELRHTVLTLVAFHDLQQKIDQCGGDREAGIRAFCEQNNGEGWMLPETLRLADYGLGNDDRAKVHQPVVERLGPRFYDWQLAQTPEESWRECHLHARNLLGEMRYQHLLEEIEAEKRGELKPDTAPDMGKKDWKAKQRRLFE